MYLNMIRVSDLGLVNFLPTKQKNELIASFKNLLANKQNDKYFVWGDYKELLLLFLSVVNRNLVVLLQTPGATNKAQSSFYIV